MKIETAEFVLSARREGQFLRDGRPEVAFVGRSNVGKSSLMNRLLRRKGLARTSSTPGRTQAVNYFLIDGRFYFVDLPGYGYAKAPEKERQHWADLMECYFQREEVQPLLLQLVDAKVGATALDVQAMQYLGALGHRPLVVATKIDKVPRSRRARGLKAIRQRLELVEGEEVIPFSAVSGEGMKPIWNRIKAFLESDSPS